MPFNLSYSPTCKQSHTALDSKHHYNIDGAKRQTPLHKHAVRHIVHHARAVEFDHKRRTSEGLSDSNSVHNPVNTGLLNNKSVFYIQIHSRADENDSSFKHFMQSTVVQWRTSSDPTIQRSK